MTFASQLIGKRIVDIELKDIDTVTETGVMITVLFPIRLVLNDGTVLPMVVPKFDGPATVDVVCPPEPEPILTVELGAGVRKVIL